ncbi:ABC transporter ATP-binding protein [Kordiimonas marina]|uniref:ABC transporter ATP-binding protein n=1 Tax=Kordiimonas marina TaxID=2872312 RepID=UPI001FF69415|nr:ABC transporter ATP-binding protein [Kordiimonas marina]MCJ9430073.1 ABC transporter ATP-binding protein [Kordiimonas marina]
MNGEQIRDGLRKSSLLHIEDVYKRYGSKTILDDIDLSVASGEFVTLVGPSGCGKSTLLRLVIGQEAPCGGSILMEGEPLGPPTPERGVVYQNYSLFPHLTSIENVTLSRRLALQPWQWHSRKKTILEEGMHYLEKVSMADHAQKFPAQLSGGQRQRVAIAQALIQKSRILCMDEPFSALDPGTRESLQMFLLELWEETKMTFFFVTHDLEEAVYLGTRLIALSQYYTDDRNPEAPRGAKIVVDRKFGPSDHAVSPSVKSTAEFASAVQEIRKQAFDPHYLQHVTSFDLSHPMSWVTHNAGEVAGEQPVQPGPGR